MNLVLNTWIFLGLVALILTAFGGIVGISIGQMMMSDLTEDALEKVWMLLLDLWYGQRDPPERSRESGALVL